MQQQQQQAEEVTEKTAPEGDGDESPRDTGSAGPEGSSAQPAGHPPVPMGMGPRGPGMPPMGPGGPMMFRGMMPPYVSCEELCGERGAV